LVHSYSLIHDDLPALDDDDLRRGQPTAHKIFGEGMALLAGDALLTEAFQLMSSPDAMRCVAPELVVRLIHELSHAAGVGGLVGGQALDLEAENENDVDLATVEWIHVRKTGALILASVRIGAQVAGAQPADLGRVSRYGERLGLAFQIADDILDALGQTAAGEGSESSHNEHKKVTYPSVVGLPQARETLKELLQLCLDELATYGAQAAPLKGIARHIVARAIQGDSKLLSEEINS
jgi:geranylgeranyl diphosphate synthase type II